MKNYFSTFVLPSICAVALCFLLTACGPAGNTGGPESSADKKQEQDSGPSGIYAMEIEPLTPVECGRCHNYQFKWLQDKGGKHQFDCTTCHEQFHAYNPRKGNWDEIMPKCQDCHDLPHGKDFPACLECHQQPHAPKVIQFDKLDKTVPGQEGVVTCSVCHKNEGAEFARLPSKHNTEVNCQGCHAEVHRAIPSCLDCHDPHMKQQEYKDCLLCHSPHSAADITYPEEIPNIACGACHESVHSKLQTNVTKHSSLQCATCHPTHGEIASCRDCHGEPHGGELHKRFTNCLDCHMDPHNLPAKTQS
jgi:hypothetical protein